MASFNLGLPDQVNQWWFCFGFAEALRRVTVQQRGADSVNALNYYSAIIAAMNAVNSQSVPAVPAFGAAATKDYCYGLASLPPLAVIGKITDWAVGRASILQLSAVGAAT